MGPALYTVSSVYGMSISALPPAVVIAYLFIPNIPIFQVSIDYGEGEAMTLLCHPTPPSQSLGHVSASSVCICGLVLFTCLLVLHFVPGKVSALGCLPQNTHSCLVSKMVSLPSSVLLPGVMAAAAVLTLLGPMRSEPPSPSALECAAELLLLGRDI